MLLLVAMLRAGVRSARCRGATERARIREVERRTSSSTSHRGVYSSRLHDAFPFRYFEKPSRNPTSSVSSTCAGAEESHALLDRARFNFWNSFALASVSLFLYLTLFHYDTLNENSHVTDSLQNFEMKMLKYDDEHK